MAVYDRNVLLGIGGNQPNSGRTTREILEIALRLIAKSGFCVNKISHFYNTPAYPAGSGPDYLNAAVSAGWQGSADEALAALHSIEAELARTRDSRWASRTVDIDLLAFGDRILPDKAAQAQWMALPLERQMTETPQHLILPHPRMQDRAFVLVPLAEIAPDWCHPITGKSVLDMRDALPASDLAQIRRIET